ncbi:hypothetical protein PYW07_001814 [Mythimna separata]|uniref:RING-CH-type domain-containing protein n=1 Tax=Mythimna separata TaxID=271217 RepID=A0AAD7YVZ2_MYTSE|nr:hypothetical protein PYW07_001814 [Mythimna separata]
MPNTRRRRFSIRDNEVNVRETKLQNGLQSRYILEVKKSMNHSDPDPEPKLKATNEVATKSIKPKPKMYANTSKNSSLPMVTENASSSFSTMTTDNKCSRTTLDKEIGATSSSINFYNEVNTPVYSSYSERPKLAATVVETPKKTIAIEKKDGRLSARDRTPMRRDKFPRQHRIKVRSPKRRVPSIEPQNKAIDSNTRTVGTTAIDWGVEIELFSVDDIADLIETAEDDERLSTHSYDDMCRICHGGDSLTTELGSLISACSCRGTVGRVHVKCLERWLTESGKSRCELCGTRYATRRVHKYGVPRALVMWVLSHNAKQLMVDSLGIMLMSPLAVLAAWLSGRTLAGLMTQESQVTPWPLASTFVLACMTLVCYYCWIVSAATRHALGWWIWYRSQYEVRLQLQENEEQTTQI